MQLFLSSGKISEDYNYNYIIESLAELILEKCNCSWGKPSDYNYISEFQEELILKNITHTIYIFLIGQEFKL